MKVLVDTSVVVGFVARGQPRNLQATDAVKNLTADEHQLFIVPQVCYEFWAVATRPKENNGLGMSHADALADLTQIQDLFTLLRDERTVYEHWKAIIDRFRVLGKSAHGARLVAALNRHGLTHLLTFNAADFRRYPGIEVLEPATLGRLRTE